MTSGWTDLYLVETEDCIVCRYGGGRDPEGAVRAGAEWRASKEIGMCQSHCDDLDRFERQWQVEGGQDGE